MICLQCGTKNPDGAKFCCICGAEMKAWTKTGQQTKQLSQAQEAETKESGKYRSRKITLVIALIAAIGACTFFGYRYFKGGSGTRAEAKYPIELAIDAPNYDKTATPVPILVVGTTADGKKINQTVLVGGVDAFSELRLPAGDYTLEVISSPILQDGTLFRRPEALIPVSIVETNNGQATVTAGSGKKQRQTTVSAINEENRTQANVSGNNASTAQSAATSTEKSVPVAEISFEPINDPSEISQEEIDKAVQNLLDAGYEKEKAKSFRDAAEKKAEESKESVATEEPVAETEDEKEPKEEVVHWETIYADKVREKGADCSYNLIYLDDDDIPELYVQKVYEDQGMRHVEYLFYTIRENRLVEVLQREDMDHPVTGRYSGQETVLYAEKAGTLAFDDGFAFMAGWEEVTEVYQVDATGVATLQYTVKSTDGADGRHDERISPDGSEQPISEKEAEELSLRNATICDTMKTYDEILRVLSETDKTEQALAFDKDRFEKDLLEAKQFYQDWYLTHGALDLVDTSDEITGVGIGDPYGAEWPYYAVKGESHSVSDFQKEAHPYYSKAAMEEIEKKQKDIGYDPLFAEKDGKLYLPKADGLGGFFEAKDAEVSVTKESDEKYKVHIVMEVEVAAASRTEEFEVDYMLEEGEWCFSKTIDTYLGQGTNIHYTYTDA